MQTNTNYTLENHIIFLSPVLNKVYKIDVFSIFAVFASKILVNFLTIVITFERTMSALSCRISACLYVFIQSNCKTVQYPAQQRTTEKRKEKLTNDTSVSVRISHPNVEL